VHTWFLSKSFSAEWAEVDIENIPMSFFIIDIVMIRLGSKMNFISTIFYFSAFVH